MHQPGTRIAAIALALSLAGFSTQCLAATVTKANNTDALDQGSSWVGGVVPGSTDVIRWDSTVTGANSTVLGSNLAVAGIQIVNPGGLITIGDNTLVLSLGAAGIDMTTATRNVMITAEVTLTAAQSWDVGSGRLLDSNNNPNNAGITVNTGGHALTVQGAGDTDLGTVTGSGGLVKNGTGTLRLQSGGSWTYTGDVTVNAGMVRVGNAAGTLGSGSSQLFLNGGSLTFVSNFANTNYGRNTTIGGDVGFVNSSSTGTGSQNYSFGTLEIGQHTVSVTANGSGTISFGATTLTGSPTFDVGSSEGNVLQLGAIGETDGPRSITKTGIGTLQLTAANTYAGDTTIAGGTLRLGSGGSFANSPRIIVGSAGSTGAVLDLSEKTAFAIAASQTLEGTGTVRLGGGTNLTINGLLSPGSSPGLLTFDGGGTTTLAGTTLMEIQGTSRGVLGGYDAIDISGGTTFSLGGILELDLAQTFADGTTFSLFTPDFSSSLTNTFASITMVGSAYADLTFADENEDGFWTTNVGGANQSMTFDSSTGELAILVVPEPATLVLVAAAAGFVLLRRRLTPRLPARLP